jgi:hypothetical protein
MHQCKILTLIYLLRSIFAQKNNTARIKFRRQKIFCGRGAGFFKTGARRTSRCARKRERLANLAFSCIGRSPNRRSLTAAPSPVLYTHAPPDVFLMAATASCAMNVYATAAAAKPAFGARRAMGSVPVKGAGRKVVTASCRRVAAVTTSQYKVSATRATSPGLSAQTMCDDVPAYVRPLQNRRPRLKDTMRARRDPLSASFRD